MLSGTVYADPCSDFFGRSGVTIGIIGASNDVSQSYDAFLKQLCPETTFVNKAVGSASPQKQLAEQLPHFLTNPVDLLIINPSGNGVCDATGGYKEAVKDILFRVKDQSPDTKTVLLTVSPRAGAAGQNNDCVKKFNTEVLTTTNEYNADFIVDIYPILEDPLGSGYCGYCGADRLHWTYFGDKRVALTIFYNVFKQTSPPADEMSTPPAGGIIKGTPSATTEPTAPPATIPLISQNCNNQQRCKEIDEAWLKLGLKGDQVWVPDKGWYDKAQVYGGEKIVSTPQQTVAEEAIDSLKTASPNQINDFIRNTYGEEYIEDVEYLTRILTIERGCNDQWRQERGAIAQVVVNRALNPTKIYGSTIKAVVATDGGRSWFGAPNSKIDDSSRGIEGGSQYRGCLLSALKFMSCVGEENIGASEVGGRDHFVHRCTQVASGRSVPSWNYVNDLQVQPEYECAAYFSGKDTSAKACFLRKYR